MKPLMRCVGCSQRNLVCDRKQPCTTCSKHQRKCTYRSNSIRCEPCSNFHLGCDNVRSICGTCRRYGREIHCKWKDQHSSSKYDTTSIGTSRVQQASETNNDDDELLDLNQVILSPQNSIPQQRQLDSLDVHIQNRIIELFGNVKSYLAVNSTLKFSTAVAETFLKRIAVIATEAIPFRSLTNVG